MRGQGYYISAIIEDDIVTILAEKLQNPKEEAAKIVGMILTLAMYAILKVALIPNFDNIINNFRYALFSQKIIKRIYPNPDNKNIETKLIFGPNYL